MMLKFLHSTGRKNYHGTVLLKCSTMPWQELMVWITAKNLLISLGCAPFSHFSWRPQKAQRLDLPLMNLKVCNIFLFFFFPLLITLNLCEKRKLMSLLSVWALRHTILRIKALFSRAYLFYHWLTLETLPWNTTAKITQQVYRKWSWKGTVVFMFNRLPFINFSGEYKDFYYEGN